MDNMNWRCAIRVVFVTTILVLVHSQEQVVNTQYGKVKGQTQKLDGKKFTTFYGIPYAAQPVGKLRFSAPQKHEGWGEVVLDALEYGPACPQPYYDWADAAFPPHLVDIQVEDEACLSLDIFVTGDMSNTNMRLPVIVFIHGGGFVLGHSRFEPGDALVTHGQPVVMVTIQYRLGILGFLTSGDDVISGNNGLKDQSFALRWVQENIAAFGGDPNQVTICGESAGGESILAHMISPMSSGLFHRASSQSPVAAWIYPPKEKLRGLFHDFVASTECEGDSLDAIECLRRKPLDSFINTTIAVEALSQRVIDGEFMTDEPAKLWANGEYNDAELMVGFTTDDGTFLAKHFLNSLDIDFDFATNRSKDLEIWDGLINALLILQLSDEKDWTHFDKIKKYDKVLMNREHLYTVLKSRYLDAYKDPLEKARGLLDCIRDNFFGIFTLWVANQVARNNGNVYVYVFDHATEFLELNKPGGVKFGPPHAAELPYQFGYGITDPDVVTMTEDERTLTHSVIQAWTSFATGEPSYLTMAGEKSAWLKYTAEEHNFLTFNTDMSADSVQATEEWQQVLDLWLAIDALAVWGDPHDAADDASKSNKEEL